MTASPAAIQFYFLWFCWLCSAFQNLAQCFLHFHHQKPLILFSLSEGGAAASLRGFADCGARAKSCPGDCTSSLSRATSRQHAEPIPALRRHTDEERGSCHQRDESRDAEHGAGNPQGLTEECAYQLSSQEVLAT